jgi:hypothetical protein
MTRRPGLQAESSSAEYQNRKVVKEKTRSRDPDRLRVKGCDEAMKFDPICARLGAIRRPCAPDQAGPNRAPAHATNPATNRISVSSGRRLNRNESLVMLKRCPAETEEIDDS